MSSESYDVGAVRIHLIEWPPSTPTGDGRIRTHWNLEAMGSVEQSMLEACLDGFSADRSGFTLEGAADGRSITITSTCAEDMPVTDRILAISPAWLSIDQRIARIWKIENTPRAFWVFAMSQRRRLLEELNLAGRWSWIAATLLRSEPLYAAIAGKSSRAREFLVGDRVDLSESQSGLRRWLGELVESIESLGGRTRYRDVTSDLTVDDLGATLAQALRRAGRGIDTDSVTELAGASEYLFEALYMLDGLLGTDLAFAEDRAWYDDAQELARDSAATDVAGRAVARLQEIENVSRTNDIAGVYLGSIGK